MTKARIFQTELKPNNMRARLLTSWHETSQIQRRGDAS
jgi:hypothetical protein